MQIPPQYIILGPYKKTDIVIDSWFKLFEFSRQLHLLSNERFVFVTGTRVMRYLRLIFCSLVLKPEWYSKGPNTLSHLRLSSIAAAGKSSRGENLIRMIRILKKAYHPLKPGIPTCSEKSSESSKSDARPIEYSGFV